MTGDKNKHILFLGLALFIWGCNNFTDSFDTKNPTEKLPIRILSIQIEEDQRKELFNQLEKFSEKNQLSFNLDFVEGSQGEEIFFVEMYGEDLTISALSSPTPYITELDIGFYEEDPSNPPSQEVIDELYNDLKFFLEEIDGVLILE